MSKQREPLPEWLTEIEARLRDGYAMFGARPVLKLLRLCRMQRKALAMERWKDADRTTLVDEYREAERLWEGK